MMTESFLNDETKAYLDSLTPNRETICDCSTCGKGLTCADVDAIPPEMFHEDTPSCATCCADGEKATRDSKWRACVDCEEEITVWWDAEGDAYCAGCYTNAGFTCDGCHNEACVQCNEDEDEETCAKCKGEFGEDCPFASTRDTTLCKDCYLNSHLDEDETDDEE